MRAFSTHQAIPIPLWDFTKGLYCNVPSAAIPEGGSQYAKDVMLFEGRVHARYPFRQYDEAPPQGNTDPVNHVFGAFFLSSGYYLIRSTIAGGTTVDVDYFDGNNWVNLLTGLSGTLGQPPSSCQFKEEFLFATGDSELYRWTGSGAMVTIDSLQATADLRPPDKPYYMVSNASNLFLGNVVIGGVRYPRRVCWCSHRDSLVWNPNGTGNPLQYTAGYSDLDHDPSEVSGLSFHGGQDIIALKRGSVYKAVWVGMPIGYKFVPITTSVGCLSHWTIQIWRDIMIWLGNDFHVYVMPFRGKITPFGDAVRRRIEELLHLPKAKQAVGSLDSARGIYRLFLPDSSGVLKKFVDCNLATGSWTEGEILHSTISVLSAAELKPGYSRSRTLYGAADGTIYTHYGETAAERILSDGETPTRTDYAPIILTGVFDAVKLAAQAGETMELHAISIQGRLGQAIPVFRVGKTIQEIENASVQQMQAINMDGVEDQAYSTGVRSNAERFIQVGVYWPGGTAVPMILDGITAWVMPRGDVR